MPESYTLESEKLAAILAEALRRDDTGTFRDEVLFELLSTIRGSEEPASKLKVAAVLISIARRIELSAGTYPSLVGAAAELAGDHPGTEHERALHASNTVIRPLAEACLRDE